MGLSKDMYLQTGTPPEQPTGSTLLEYEQVQRLANNTTTTEMRLSGTTESTGGVREILPVRQDNPQPNPQTGPGLVPGTYQFIIETIDQFGGITNHAFDITVQAGTGNTVGDSIDMFAGMEGLMTDYGTRYSGVLGENTSEGEVQA